MKISFYPVFGTILVALAGVYFSNSHISNHVLISKDAGFPVVAEGWEIIYKGWEFSIIGLVAGLAAGLVIYSVLLYGAMATTENELSEKKHALQSKIDKAERDIQRDTSLANEKANSHAAAYVKNKIAEFEKSTADKTAKLNERQRELDDDIKHHEAHQEKLNEAIIKYNATLKHSREKVATAQAKKIHSAHTAQRMINKNERLKAKIKHLEAVS